MQLKKSTIDRYRRKWVAFMKVPDRKKARQKLQHGETELRCCLGHACVALGMSPKIVDGYAYFNRDKAFLPEYARERLQIDKRGTFVRPIVYKGKMVKDLTLLNDKTDATPAEIGEIIRENFKNNNFHPWY